jgi:hypothetical protein
MGNRSSALRVFLYLTVIVVLFSSGLVAQAELVSSRELVNQRNAHTRVHEFIHRVPIVDPLNAHPGTDTVESRRTVVEKGTDINYRDDQGQWQKTNTAIELSHTEGFIYEAAKQRAKVRFAPLGGLNVEYEVGGGSVRLGIRSIGYFDRSTGQRHLISSATNVSPQIRGNSLLYVNAFPGADIEYVNENVDFKQNVILKDKNRLPNPATYGMSATSTYFVVVTEIDVSASNKRLWADGVSLESVAAMEASEFRFKDIDDRIVHYLARGKAWDSSDPQVEETVYKRVIRRDGKMYLLEGIPYETLMQMTFPVTIDYIQKTTGSVGNEVWDRSKTWWVSSAYNINNGDTLVIEPGTVVKLGDDSAGYAEKINILSGGVLKAVGEPYSPIIITSYADDGCGEDIDTGVGGLPSEITPAPSNYTSAFWFNYCGSNNSEIQFCRIRFAHYGIFAYDTQLNNDVRDNIFYQCNRGIQQHIANAATSSADYINNLISDCSYPILLANQTSYTYSLTANLYNNTIDGAYSIGVYTYCVNGGLTLTMTAQNNIVTNTNYGFHDGQGNMTHSSGTISHNGFSNVSTNYGTGFSGTTTRDLVTTNPYVTSSNGNYYLDQTTIFEDGGTGSLATLGLDDKTTIMPTEVSVGDAYSSNQTWSAVAYDTSTVDLGYHHPRVDRLIGNNATASGSYITYYTAIDVDLTIDPGVVIASYRPTASDVYPGIYIESDGTIDAEGTSSSPIRFDSSYYLGTNFYNQTGSSTFGQIAQHMGVLCYGDGAFSYCHFRHCFGAICYYHNPVEPIANNVFERCYCGIYVEDTDTDWLNPVQINNNLFLDNESSALAVYSDDYSSCAEFFANTVQNCNMGVYLRVVAVGPHSYVDFDRTIIMNCKIAGVTGCDDEAWQDLSQKVHFWEDTNLFWNNGIDEDLSVDSDTLTVYDSPVIDNPLLVSKSSETEEREYHGHYLLQNNGDASEIPFRFSKVATTGAVAINDVNNWPDGNWDVYVCALENLNDYPTVEGKAWFTYYEENYTSGVYASAYTESDMLVLVQCNGGDICSNGDPYFDVQMKNGSEIRVYLDGSELEYMSSGEKIGYWIALDGSAYYANKAHSGEASWDDVVDQNARYAMRFDSTGLARSAEDAGAESPALEICGPGMFFEASTSTAGGTDYYPTDAGYHYGGSVVVDHVYPDSSVMTWAANSSYIYSDADDLLYYKNHTGETITLTATMDTGETNPYLLCWTEGFNQSYYEQAYTTTTNRIYTLDTSTDTTSIGVTFMDKAGNTGTYSLTTTYDGTAPTGTFSSPPSNGSVICGLYQLKASVTETGAGIKTAEFYWGVDKVGDAEIIDGIAYCDMDVADWTETSHTLYLKLEDNVSNAQDITLTSISVDKTVPVMTVPDTDAVNYIAYNSTSATCSVTFTDTSSISNIYYQVDGYKGTWTSISITPGTTVNFTFDELTSQQVTDLAVGYHSIYLKAVSADGGYSGHDGSIKLNFVKLPDGAGSTPHTGACDGTGVY